MLSHIIIGVRNLESLTRFYDAALAPLGLVRTPEQDDGGPAGEVWRRPGVAWPHFYIQYPLNGLPATWGNGVQISFAAPSRQAVEGSWQAAMDNGGTHEGRPGLRPNYGPDYYGAYCRDPEGNKLCFVHTADLAGTSA